MPARLRSGTSVLALLVLLISTVGDEVATVALALRGADRTGVTAVVSAQMIAGLLPGIVLGGPIGRIVDRYRTDVVLAVTLAFEAAVAGTAAVLADDAVLLITTVLALGTLGAVAQTCVMALVPRLYPDVDEQFRVNSVMESTRNAGYILGPALVGLLASRGGTSLALAVDAGTFTFALVAMPVLSRWLAAGRVWRPAALEAAADAERPDPGKPPEEAERPDPAKGGLRTGLTLLWSGRRRRMTLSVIVLTVAATSCGNVVLPFFARELPGDAVIYGTLLSTWSVGLVLGPVLIRGRFARPTSPTVIGAATVIGLSYVVAGAAPLVPVMLFAFLCGGMANALQNVALRTYVMSDCPAEVRGRVAAAYGATLQSAVGIGFALAGLTPAEWARWSLFTGGAIAAVAGIAGWLRVQTSAVHGPEGAGDGPDLPVAPETSDASAVSDAPDGRAGSADVPLHAEERG